MTVPELLAARAAGEPDRTALRVAGGGSLTFGDWERRSAALAGALVDRGVARGDRVGLLFGDDGWIELAVAWCAVQRAGAAAVPLGTRLAPAETRHALLDCGAAGVVHGAGVRPPATGGWVAAAADLERTGSGDPGVDVRPDDLAQILYTSGTTGRSKGVAASHANLAFGLPPPPGRRPLAHSELFLHAFPIGTNAGQTTLVDALVARPAALVAPVFEPDGFCALIAAHRVGTVFLVPAMAIALLNARAFERHDASSVVLVGSTAAPLPPAVAAALAEALPDATIVNTYTSTESAPARTAMVFDPDRPASVGLPGPGAEVAVTDAGGEPLPAGEVGEVWLRSQAPPRAYYGDERATTEAFGARGVRMGDLGYLDADGYLYLIDREGDLVKSGAFKVSSLQVEAALHEHPAVADAAVVGIPHPVMGSVVAAAIVPRAPVDAGELRAFLGERLARHELPARIELVESLPRNPAGKVLKRELRTLLAARRPAAPIRPPSTPAEMTLSRLWARALDLRAVGADADFFELGGDSLKASQLVTLASEAFGVDVPASLVFEAPVLAAQAARIDALAPAAPAPGTASGTETSVPLSAQQESFLGWMRESDGRHPGWIGSAIRVRDELDHEVLRRALEEVARRHEALRTVIVTRDGCQQGLVLPDCPPEMLSLCAASGEQAQELVRHARASVPDITSGPLVEGLAIQLAERDHVLLLLVSHLVFDGWSMGVLLRELGLVYSAFAAGQPSPLPPAAMQCSELFAWAREQWPRTRAYWQRTLDGAPAAIARFPGRAPVDRFTRASHAFRIDAGAAGRLRAAARALGATPFMAVTACWTAVIASWSGVTDLVLMTPVPGRTKPELEALMGCLVQSLLPRVDTGGDPTFAELLARARTAVLGALDHQFYPYEEFRVRFPHAVWVRYESWAGLPHLPGLESEPFAVPREPVAEEWEIPGGDLTVPELTVSEQPDGSLSGWLVFNVYAFERPTVERLAHAFLRLVDRAVERPDLKLSELSR